MAEVLAMMGDAADSVVQNVVVSSFLAASLKVVQSEVKKRIGKEIEVEAENIPLGWMDWISKTGVNSLCNGDTWEFLEAPEGAKTNPRREKWDKLEIKKIVIAVDESPGEDRLSWAVCEVGLSSTDASTLRVVWFPAARRVESDCSWLDHGERRYWNLYDEFVFGLSMYEQPGELFYKSGWLNGFEDVNPSAFLEGATKKFKRWFQFRHWCIFWFADAMPGWNYQYTKKVLSNPPTKDSAPFTLQSTLEIPPIANFTFPTIKLPTLPEYESLAMPSFPPSGADENATPLPVQRSRPEKKYYAHGIIELPGLYVRHEGTLLMLTNATVHNFWDDSTGGVKAEMKDKQCLELECDSEEQAESWLASMLACGVKEGEFGKCCAGCC